MNLYFTKHIFSLRKISLVSLNLLFLNGAHSNIKFSDLSKNCTGVLPKIHFIGCKLLVSPNYFFSTNLTYSYISIFLFFITHPHGFLVDVQEDLRRPNFFGYAMELVYKSETSHPIYTNKDELFLK